MVSKILLALNSMIREVAAFVSGLERWIEKLNAALLFVLENLCNADFNK